MSYEYRKCYPTGIRRARLAGTYCLEERNIWAIRALGRENKSEVKLNRHLLDAFKNLNPDLPETAFLQAIELIEQKSADKTLARINKEKYELLKEGIPVSLTNCRPTMVATGGLFRRRCF